jgi:hypothetical protein
VTEAAIPPSYAAKEIYRGQREKERQVDMNERASERERERKRERNVAQYSGSISAF